MKIDQDKPAPHPHKCRVIRVCVTPEIYIIYGQTFYWQVSDAVCGPISLHGTWERAIIKAVDHPGLWDFAEQQKINPNLLFTKSNMLYTAKNEISDRFTPR